jgi:hypothetical protein
MRGSTVISLALLCASISSPVRAQGPSREIVAATAELALSNVRDWVAQRYPQRAGTPFTVLVQDFGSLDRALMDDAVRRAFGTGRAWSAESVAASRCPADASPPGCPARNSSTVLRVATRTASRTKGALFINVEWFDESRQKWTVITTIQEVERNPVGSWVLSPKGIGIGTP